ncbi:MAG: hypothetical protein ACRDHW_12900, partial [Ktedonobacteraceae bacterium]
ACCAPNIFVQNENAFVGGQDAQPNTQVLPDDIARVADPLRTTLTQSAQASLQGQVRSNERAVADSLHCLSNVSANPPAGTVAPTFTVTVAVTCGEIAYDYLAARTLTAALLQRDSGLSSAYRLADQLAMTVLSANATSSSSQVNLRVHAQGRWVYSFSSAYLHQLAMQIAGKSQADAKALLLQQTEIADVQFSSAGKLPASTNEILVTVGSDLVQASIAEEGGSAIKRTQEN